MHVPARMRLSLRNRLAAVFFAITLVAIAALYLYVAPGLQTRLLNEKRSELAASAARYSGRIVETIGSAVPSPEVRRRIDAAGLASGDRVTLLLVTHLPSGPQLSPVADSSKLAATTPLTFPVATRAAITGARETGIEITRDGTVAEAAYPVHYQGRVGAVIVYSDPVSDIVRSVAVVRHEILVAGGIAALLALVGGYFVARALGQRVKRLELAAEKVAAGDFDHPIAVDSSDELGQLAIAFNAMQRQLAQLEETRKKFIATASHELRTPIFSLGGFVELLEDDDLDPETRRRFLDQVSEQVERLRKLSVDLLDLSRLESGSLELRPEQVDLGELTRSVSGEFEPALAQHDSHLELRLPTRSIDAVCDPVRVAQIMRILIDNALTHTGSGTRIVVTAGRENGRVRLVVRDDGRGIDPQSISRIFEPFYTADDAQGSGLGLAIASELAERMDGRLSVASAPWETTFTLELPVQGRGPGVRATSVSPLPPRVPA
jgi:two-component system, OmpR family, sensor kinase